MVTNPVLPKSGYTPKTKSVMEAFMKILGRPMSPTHMECYDGIWIMAEAIKKAASTDPDKIIEALRATNWNGTRGKYYFHLENDPGWKFQQWPEAPIYLAQYNEVGQKPEDAPVLWPRNMATSEKLYLTPPK
jgi:branched-chain amino acid transport system substrate-binding protein